MKKIIPFLLLAAFFGGVNTAQAQFIIPGGYATPPTCPTGQTWNGPAGKCVANAVTSTNGTGAVRAVTSPNAFCKGGSCTYVLLEPLPGLPDCYGPNPPPNTCRNAGGTFQGLITSSFQLLLGAGAITAIVMLVLGALTYMFSDVVGNKTKALGRIRGAMWGIILLLSSYLILNTINPDLVTFKLNLGSNSGAQSGPQYITPQQTQDAINNQKINQCQNGTNTTQICTVLYASPTDSAWECVCNPLN